jgi:hypothetical protein
VSVSRLVGLANFGSGFEVGLGVLGCWNVGRSGSRRLTSPEGKLETILDAVTWRVRSIVSNYTGHESGRFCSGFASNDSVEIGG